jgi:ribosomal-protein-alanine acetyltransferase
MGAITVRRGEPSDLPRIASIQAASPQAAAWTPTAYLQYDFSVAIAGDEVQGFLATRAVAPDEWEVLNLAVSPEFRRRGAGRALLEPFLQGVAGAVFLEVRQSNEIAREFYKSLGFQELTLRSEYYENPPEPAVVMKYHS